MKQMTLILFLVAFCHCLIAQKKTDSLQSQDYYLNKSQNQKMLAWPLTVAGVGMTTIGVFNWAIYGLFNSITGEGKRRSHLGAITASTGAAALGGGLSLFSSARRNKQRAADMDMYIERLPITGMAGPASGKLIPAVRIRIPL